MMRSLYSGVAGLKTHQTKMDVIGNNIANVNTTSYKSQSITFSDLLYQTTQSASGANANTGVGGTNARQIGLGSKTGAIGTAITTQGSAQSTSNPFDIMITGDSFFVVNNGKDNFFTRDGSFAVDGMGNLVMSSTGYNVMGWKTDADGNVVQDKVSALRVMSADNMTYPPEATKKGTVTGIIDKNDTAINSTAGKIMGLSFYDALGYQYNGRFSIHAIDGDAGIYYISLDKVLDSDGNELEYIDGIVNENTIEVSGKETINKSSLPKGYRVETDKDGVNHLYDDKDAEVTGDTAILAAYGVKTEDYKTAGKAVLNDNGSMTFEYTKDVENALYLKYDPETGAFDGIGATLEGLNKSNNTINVSFKVGAGAPPETTDGNFEKISMNFESTTMFNNNGTSTVSAISGDFDGKNTGRRIGQMSGISIAKDGVITATYDNGQNKILGQIAVANFANASGLEKAGDNLYSATANSGEFDGIGVDITSGGNYMTTGVLEMSNVDLAAEFTEMITTQRGFQANSRIITVSDTLLEELTNLKR